MICCIALCLLALVDWRVHAQRPVYPLIIGGLAPNGARMSSEIGLNVNNDHSPNSLQSSPESSANKDKTVFALSADSKYIRTTGTPKSCRQHADCYSLREPDEWCSAPAYFQIYDKGCFCDLSRSQCVIERQGSSGSEYTDCTDKSVSRCSRGGAAGGAAIKPDVEFSDVAPANSIHSNDIVASNSKVQDAQQLFVLSPQSVYVKTSAEAKSCRSHDDCYALREPDDWCPLAPSDKYSEKGCFCDIWSQRCLIERNTPTGAQYSDCAPKATSKCQSTASVQFSDIQKAAAEDQKSGLNEKRVQTNTAWASLLGFLTVSPQGRYVATSGKPKSCLYHQDCYMQREPNEWCPLPASDRYYEKGCFCDYARSACTIEREVPGGSEYTDCAEKSASTCQTS